MGGENRRKWTSVRQESSQKERGLDMTERGTKGITCAPESFSKTLCISDFFNEHTFISLKTKKHGI